MKVIEVATGMDYFISSFDIDGFWIYKAIA